MPIQRVSQGFRDISMTFQRNPLNDDLVALKNATAISRSVKNIVFTQPGEKFFNEDFGSRVSRFLFENIDPVTASNIKDEIVQSILNFEPRVQLIKVSVVPDYEEFPPESSFGRRGFFYMPKNRGIAEEKFKSLVAETKKVFALEINGNGSNDCESS